MTPATTTAPTRVRLRRGLDLHRLREDNVGRGVAALAAALLASLGCVFKTAGVLGLLVVVVLLAVGIHECLPLIRTGDDDASDAADGSDV